MACRSCGIGPSRANKTIERIKAEEAAAKAQPTKGVVPPKRKTLVPTRSPARTFRTMGEN